MRRGIVEVAVGGGRRADADGLVGEVEVGRAAVGLAVDGDDFDAQVVAGADDAQGDLAAIGDQDALEHGCGNRPRGKASQFSVRLAQGGSATGSTRNSTVLNSTESLFWTQTSRTTPLHFRLDVVEHLHRLDQAHDRRRRDATADA